MLLTGCDTPMGYSLGVADVYLGLGTNLGDRAAMLREALKRLATLGTVAQVSSMYETVPWGDLDQPSFLNLCCRLETEIRPRQLLRRLKSIEQEMGRIETRRWGPRVIDLDLLAYDDLVSDGAELRLPHPGIAERAFVLAPLAEIAPDLILAGQEHSVRALLARIPDAEALAMRFGSTEENE